jgi:hypothetical protein
MKRSALLATSSALAFAGLFSLGTAQAAAGPCFLIMPNSAASPTCATAQPRQPVAPAAAPSQRACPSQGGAGGGCMSNQELGQALGSMAASGMQIAATVMRAVTEEASRLLMAEPDMSVQ